MKKISLKRRSISSIKVKRFSGKDSFISVVRKKRKMYFECEESNKITNEKIDNKNVENESLNKNTDKILNVNKKIDFSVNGIIKDNSDYKESYEKNYSFELNIIHFNKFYLENEIKNENNLNNFVKLELNLSFLSKNKNHYLSNFDFVCLLNNDINEYKVFDNSNLENFIDLDDNIKNFKFNNANILCDFLKKNHTVPNNFCGKFYLNNKMTISDFSKSIFVNSNNLLIFLKKIGFNVKNINDFVDKEVITFVVEKMGYSVFFSSKSNKKNILNFVDDKEKQSVRPPIISVVGHVNHGKTTLLDYIRKTNIVDCESGGITQHINSYMVNTKYGFMTFIDTPGHEAFTSLRVRSLNLTDIVVLIVAADDGVKPQTREAISYAKSINSPIIVAINKIDKRDSDIDKIIGDLSRLDIISEDWGGENIFVKISAKNGIGIDDLLESISLQSEILELKANYKCSASGIVIESKIDKKKGCVASLLIKNGKLNIGDNFYSGVEYGRVKSIVNDVGKRIITALPSYPVEISGLSGTLNVGDEFFVVKTEREAKNISLVKRNKTKSNKFINNKFKQQDILFDKFKFEKIEKVNIILKTDVKGSIEVIISELKRLSDKDVTVNIVSSSVGNFNDSDINFGTISKALFIGFNVGISYSASKLVNIENINVYCFSTIYDLVDKVKEIISNKISLKSERKFIGSAIVKEIFYSSKKVLISGCSVISGFIRFDKNICIIRDSSIIHDGTLLSLRHFKKDVDEVKNGHECGICVNNYDDIKIGDYIKSYEKINV